LEGFGQGIGGILGVESQGGLFVCCGIIIVMLVRLCVLNKGQK
jgi:hypothetical protein